jgi:hypothetical protein
MRNDLEIQGQGLRRFDRTRAVAGALAVPVMVCTVLATVEQKVPAPAGISAAIILTAGAIASVPSMERWYINRT